MTCREAARELGVTEGPVRVHAHRAAERLRSLLAMHRSGVNAPRAEKREGDGLGAGNCRDSQEYII
ncbi:MAG: hypothetical protein ACREL7_08295 [Longimicrobiales bacterium]